MKKLIAISVVFALFVGVAFAQPAISGSISVRAKLLSDTITDADDPPDGAPATAQTSGEVETAYVQLSGQNSDGTFGALIRLRGNDGTGKYHRAFVWWKPIPQLQIWFGQDPDGKFCAYNAWSFYQGQESYAHDHDWGQWRAAFPGNWDTLGFAISLYPAQGVEVNVVVPIGGVGQGNGQNGMASWEPAYGNKPLEDLWFGSLQLAASVNLPDIGKVFLNVLGPGENIFDDDKNAHNGTLGVSFLLTAVQGMDFHLGFSTNLPGEVEEQPINLAAIANFNISSDFGVKFRSRFVLGPADGAFQTGVDVQPWYNLGKLRAFFNIGLIFTDTGVDGVDPVSQLIINPYIRVPVSGGDIRLGLLYKDPNLDNDNDAQITVPIQFTYSF